MTGSLTTMWTLAQAAGQQTGDNTMLLWAMLLLGLAALLFVLEIFVPSGGVIGLAAGLCLIGGIVLLFGVDTTLGLLGILATFIAMPFLIWFALRIWPETPIGRMLILQDDDDDDDAAADTDQKKQRPSTEPQVGDEGRAVTDLHPVGTCLIDGRRYDCLAMGGAIEPGTPVRVTAVDGMHIKVRAVH